MNKSAYWIKAGLQTILFIAIAGVLFGLFQSFINGALSFSTIATTGLYYAIPLSCVIICFYNITKTTFMANVVISMGETRKKAMSGIVILNVTIIVTAIAAVFVLNVVAGGKLIDHNATFICIPAMYLVSCGCGIFINSLKYENTIEASTVQSVLMLLSLALLFGLNAIMGTFFNDSIINVNDDIRYGATIFSIIFGILLCIIGYIRMKKKVMQLEIRL